MRRWATIRISARQDRTRTSIGMHSQDLGHSRPRQAAATVFRSWSRLPRLFIGIALATVCALASGPALAADVRIDDIRIASHGPITRVVIDLSAAVDFHHLALGQPPRLAIDLPEADWTLDEDASKAIGLIKGLRFGHPSPGVSRIVLDMAQPFEIKRIFELPPNGERGHRVVTDLIGMAPGGVNGVIRPAAGVAGSQTAAMTVIRPPAFKPSPPEKRIVVIDPGHGGVDPGAIGTKLKLYEKDVALRTALALRSKLEKTGRYEVVMTRNDDRIVRL